MPFVNFAVTMFVQVILWLQLNLLATLLEDTHILMSKSALTLILPPLVDLLLFVKFETFIILEHPLCAYVHT